MSENSINTSFTGSIPENYDTYLGPVLFEFTGADIARRVNKALAGRADVLEVACGTGITTRHLSKALPVGSTITATDLNDAMIDHARRVNPDLPGVTYSQDDALDLPFDDSSFDAVVCPFGIMFFPDRSLGMSEMTRVLKPGGVMALNVWDSFDQNPAIRVADRVIKERFESDPPRFLEIPFSMHEVDEGRRLFHEAGYVDVDVARVSEGIEISEFALPARGLVTGNPTMI